ncbi:unnamed protein product, partial [Durusdinium trenchii]
ADESVTASIAGGSLDLSWLRCEHALDAAPGRSVLYPQSWIWGFPVCGSGGYFAQPHLVFSCHPGCDDGTSCLSKNPIAICSFVGATTGEGQIAVLSLVSACDLSLGKDLGSFV